MDLVKVSFVLVLLAFVAGSETAYSEVSPASMASAIFSRIAGAPLPLHDPRRPEMEDLISRGRIEEAAQFATDDPQFILTTMRSIASPLSNTDGNGTIPYYDFIMTFMMAIDRDRPVTDLLSADIVYTPNPILLPFAVEPRYRPGDPGYVEYRAKVSFFQDDVYNQTIVVRIPISSPSDIHPENFSPAAKLITINPGTGPTYFAEQTINPVGYAMVNGELVDHFIEIGQNEKTTSNFGDDTDAQLLIADEDRAGLLTTRVWVGQAASGGTNRRQIKWIFERFLCTSLEEIKDPILDQRYIRRDVERAPGGDPTAFPSCVGCHGFLDPLSHAFAYFETAGGRTRYFGNRVNGSVRYGSVFENSKIYPQGFEPRDNTWVNLATGSEVQKKIGWRGPMAGRGMKSLGKMFARSRAFSKCMSKHVFRHVCRRDEEDFEESIIEEMADHLEANNYNMRRLFQKAATLNNCFER